MKRQASARGSIESVRAPTTAKRRTTRLPHSVCTQYVTTHTRCTLSPRRGIDETTVRPSVRATTSLSSARSKCAAGTTTRMCGNEATRTCLCCTLTLVSVTTLTVGCASTPTWTATVSCSCAPLLQCWLGVVALNGASGSSSGHTIRVSGYSNAHTTWVSRTSTSPTSHAKQRICGAILLPTKRTSRTELKVVRKQKKRDFPYPNGQLSGRRRPSLDQDLIFI